jgi:TetR/AcrR family transcriptional regulator, transcriptional repressor of bet genes
MSSRRSKPAGAAAGSRQRSSATRQRQRLIDACISALHLYGPSQTTVEKVVAIAKLSPGIVRFYFKSKSAMLLASLRFLSAEFESQVLEPVGQLSDRPVQALEKMIELYLDPAIASTRKVSVWYAFWGEATARQEYQEICGQKDERFAILVLELIKRMIAESGQHHLNADAIALGLIGALEVLWQGIAFQTEGDVDRAGARQRCMAYLSSVFPGCFAAPAGTSSAIALPADGLFALERERCFLRAWQLLGHCEEIPASGDYLTLDLAATRALVLRDDAQLRAFHNNCPHWPHALVTQRRGHFEGHVRCPLHQLDFDLAGRSGRAGEDLALSAMNLSTVSGLIFVSNGSLTLPKAPFDEPFDEQNSDPLDPTPIGSCGFAEYELAADWKIAVEQLLAHRLADHESIGGVQRFCPPTVQIDTQSARITWLAEPVGGDNWSGQRLASLARGRPRSRWQRCFIWPNLVVEARPDGLSALQVIAVSPGECRLQCFDYWRPDHEAPGAAMRYLAARIARRALRLDREFAVSTQRGLSAAGYRINPAAPVARSVGAFRSMLAAALSG